jgi:DNA-binding NarL/FixJ family response regulator
MPVRPVIQEGSGASSATTSKDRVLIVEDDFILAMDMEGALTEAGFEVLDVAGNAEDAVELAESLQPDIVVMDVRLPGVRNGVDAALELFTRFELRCIFASGQATETDRQRAESARPYTWLSKPFPMRDLVQAVQRALSEQRT